MKRREGFKPWKAVSATGLSAVLFVGQTTPILANPTGGTVVAGAATIGAAGQTLTINQSTGSAIINWQQFSINSGETTKFIVPSALSATLNRVTGGNPSAIYGNLQSNGILYLVNPNGIVVGPNGRIDTAGFMASTLDVSNQQFMAGGNLHFAGDSSAGIDNQGTIHGATGDVYLIANHVDNNGTITAPQGTAGFAAGNDVLFQQAGSQHLFVQATAAGTKRATGINNSGTIAAAAAELKSAGGNAYALAINNSGSIAATGFKKVGGQVYLTSDGGNITNSGKISAKTANGNGGKIVLNGHGTSAKGTVLNSGQLVATGSAVGKKGGTVEVLGNQVGITGAGVVDASGDAGGGTALIGGDEHGSNASIADADQTYLAPDATIHADALTLGTGGKVILWGNETTQAYGQISATGGAKGGNGGFVETSAANLQATTAPNLTAPHGKSGTWLLDPSTVVISDAGSDTGFTTSPAFTINSGVVTITQATLLTALQSGNVTIDASTGSGGGGTITWMQTATPFNIANAGNNLLTLSAPTSITFQGVTINASGTGGLNLTLNPGLLDALGHPLGSVNVQSSTINLHGGTFIANGNGYTSTTDSNGEANGVNLFNTSINAGGGDIFLTGNAGFTAGSGATLAGLGVGIGSDGTTNVTLGTSGTGNITINGTFNQNITSRSFVGGVALYEDVPGSNVNHMTVADGTISITGSVLQGIGAGTDVLGVDIQQGSVISATGSGAVSITGDASAASVVANGAVPIVNGGVRVAGALSLSSGNLTIHGLGGVIDTSGSTIVGGTNNPFSVGVIFDSGGSLTTSQNATVTITGTGGAVTTTSAFTGDSGGIDFDTGTSLNLGTGATLNATGFGGAVNAGNGSHAGDAETAGIDVDASSITVATGGAINLNGTGGLLNTSNASAIATSAYPTTQGVTINRGSTLTAEGSAAITIIGSTLNVNSGNGLVGGAIGVGVTSPSNTSNLITSSSGNIAISGTAGSAPGSGIGVLVDGFNLGSSTISSSTGIIILSGTGGAGYNGTGSVVGNYVPNFGVAIADNATISTGATLGLIGTGGAHSNGVSIQDLTNNTVLDASPVAPTLSSSSVLSIQSLSGSGIDVNGALTTPSVVFTSDANLVISSILNLPGALAISATGNIFDTASVTAGSFILSNGTWIQVAGQNGLTALPAFTDPGDFELQNSSTFERFAGGAGTTGSPYQIADSYGLQGLGSPSQALLTAHAVLANDIDASGTTDWNGGAGFVPIGFYDFSNSADANTFSGSLDGQNHTINGLFIDRANSNSGTGLFGDTATGSTLTNLNLTNVNITGNEYVGGVVGVSNSTVTGVASSGNVTGVTYVGGLFGITAAGISGSHSSATVNGSTDVGGLIGYMQLGSLTTSYATGAVTAGTNGTGVGGLVGLNGGAITYSYSTGPVITGASSFPTGGLVGDNEGSIGFSYSTSVVTAGAGSQEDGGLVGLNSNAINDSYSTGSVHVSNGNAVGGLIGDNAGTLHDTYTTDAIVGQGNVHAGGLVGFSGGGAINNSFWDTQTAGVTLGVGSDSSNTTAGVVGATTANLMSQAFILQNSTVTPGFDFTSVWTTHNGTTTPQLLSLAQGSTGNGTLSGIAFIDSGGNFSPGVLLDLIVNGTVIGTTTTDSSGNYSFSVTSGNLTSGVLITNATNHGDIFYQLDTPTGTTFTNVDIWGNKLIVNADTVSNAVLRAAAGSLTQNGVNYVITGANLVTNAGVSMLIDRNYLLDGNVTVRGSLTSTNVAEITGSTASTLTGNSVKIGGQFNTTGALTIVSTAGAIDMALSNSGSSSANSLTLTATGPATVDGAVITLNGGNFTVSGVGSTNSPSTDGVDILNSSINTQGGSYTITGAASSEVGNSASAGLGVSISNSELVTSSAGTPTTGNITITGTSNLGAGFTTNANLEGVDLDHSVLTLVNGALSINGTVSSATTTGAVVGVNVTNSSVVSVTGSGSIAIHGNTMGAMSNNSIGGVILEDATVSAPSGAVTITSATEATNSTSPNLFGLSVDGGMFTAGDLSVSSVGAVDLDAAVAADGSVIVQTTGGNITFGTAGSIIDSGAGNVILAAGATLANSHYFINHSTAGANAIGVADGFHFHIYSADPTNDTFGGITVAPQNVVFNASFATSGQPAADQQLFYVSSATAVGPNAPGGGTGGTGGTGSGGSTTPPSTATGGGSNIVPVVINVPPPPPLNLPKPGAGLIVGGAPLPPPVNYVGNGGSAYLGQQDGGLANSSGNSGQITPGDAAQMGGGQLNNVSNPHASIALNQALGPAVYHNLSSALTDIGDWNDMTSTATGGEASGGGDETIISAGDVVEVTGKKVKNVPASEAPEQLRQALKGFDGGQ